MSRLTISKKTPCATVTRGPSVVCVIRMSLGMMPFATAAAHMPPKIWVGNKIRPLTHGSVPVKVMPSVTAGLNRPPEIRYIVHAVTSRLKPYAMAM